MSKKSVLAKHLQMLRVFAASYAQMVALNRKSMYEAHILMKDEIGNFYKVFRYFVGHSILPDEIASICYDVYITLLKPSDINHLLEECKKYEIRIESGEAHSER